MAQRFADLKSYGKLFLMKIVILFAVSAVLLRLVPHYPNFAPVTAIALFGGAYLSKRVAFFLPLLVMVISDYLLLYVSPYDIDFSRIHPLTSLLHSTTLFVWGSFLISSLIGIWISKKKTVGRVGFAAIFASLQFFIITNFGVWFMENMYPHNFGGLLQSYVMALPFYRGTFLGDLFYTGMFFGGFELVNLLRNKYLFSRGERN